MAMVLDAILTACLAAAAIGVFGLLMFAAACVVVEDLKNRRGKRAEDTKNDNEGF